MNDPKLTRFDVFREGLRRDGIEILHYEPRYPKPGTKPEKRMERIVGFLFILAGVFSLLFLAAYIWWPWEYGDGAGDWSDPARSYTSVIGICLGLSLLFFAIGILTWAKKLLPVEELVQDRHDGPSSKEDRKITEATVDTVVGDIGLKRRPFLKKAALVGAAPLGLAAIAPLGGLIKDPEDMLTKTGWDPEYAETKAKGEQAGVFQGGKFVRLMMRDGTMVRPDMVSVGGQITVYPAYEHGASNKEALAPTLLIHLREQDAEELRENLYPMYEEVSVSTPEGEHESTAMFGNFVAYSKICTHVGCPASLYEQQSQRLLCPCHQSQFNVVDNAAPIFGPATRHLPMLPLEVDDDGYLIATSDYLVPPGPAFWNRPSLPEGWEDKQ
ncbi:ubiquinol-cytochrome c reductase iron-sulfur subunit [Haloglycomyces albus]|uniref:cytochrome bc1 complex Rieske iron-sulfur subunit n=1 Tax=Haloglycomyces albus TaxID=526067 RepID=UPI001FE10110|nr:Rieske 2Fe-2S domain-containing protein [Haloglycomyces albus]